MRVRRPLPENNLQNAGTSLSQSSGPTLKTKFLHGLAWTAGMRWAGQVATWTATIIVARILDPSDYGIFSIAMIYIAFMQLVTEFGLGTAVIAMRELDSAVIEQLNTLAVFLGICAFAITVLCSPLLAWFFHMPQLTAVTVALGTTFIIGAFQSVPMAKMQAALEYKRLSLFEILRNLLLSVAIVVFAWVGFRYWSLVLANVLGAALNVCMILAVCRVGFRWPRPNQLRPALHFSGQLLFSRLAWYSWSNADFFVVGKVLGEKALGHYTLAWNLASIPVEKLSSILLSVTPGLFAQLKVANGEMKRSLLGIMEGVALVGFPVAVGLALIAEDLIRVVLGTKWVPALRPLELLAAVACLRMIGPVFSQALVFLRDTGFELRRSLLSALLMPLFFWMGTQWGIAGVAWAWVLAFPLLLSLLFYRASHKIHFTLEEFLSRLYLPASATLAMAVVLIGVNLALPITGLVRLSGNILAGALVYCGTLLIIDRKNRVRSLLQQFRGTAPAGR
jgi:teichuronic acid exporter